jgi:hypothetical protein
MSRNRCSPDVECLLPRATVVAVTNLTDNSAAGIQPNFGAAVRNAVIHELEVIDSRARREYAADVQRRDRVE